jgi:hypothetical protein
MKNSLHCILFLAVSLFFSEKAQAQGMIVNEMSNGQAGSQEYVELLVIGSTALPTAPVDLGGWILDDNNGEFKAGTGTGVAAGHMRITPGCYSSVPVGSILLIYNANEPDPTLPAADPDDANGDGIYVIPHTNSCLQVCTASPTTSNTSYNVAGCTYITPTLTGVASWTTVGFRNGGDAVQVRKPDASFFHGYSYGDVGTVFPSFPAELGGGSAFNVNSSTGTNFGYALSCGAWNVGTSYARVGAASATPGQANDADNSNMIQNIENGSYNYDDPAAASNCLLPLYLLDFDVRVIGTQRNLLRWTLATVDPQSHANIQRSTDGYNFTTIGKMDLEAVTEERTYTYSDFTPYQTTYYRLEFMEPNAKISYSHIRVVSHNEQDNILLFPNPSREQLSVSFTEPFDTKVEYTIVDALGRAVIRGEIAKGEIATMIQTQQLAAGTYILHLQNEKMAISRSFIKM